MADSEENYYQDHQKGYGKKGLWQESRIAPRSSVARTTKSKVKDIRCLHVTTKYTVNDRGK